MSGPTITREAVLAIHSETIARFGGIDGVRDESLLDSALAQPFQTFSGQDLYPGPVEKACRYAFGITRNHPFIDGNKRTGTALMGIYLRMSGLSFKPAHNELLSTMLGVADGSVNYDELTKWARGVVQ